MSHGKFLHHTSGAAHTIFPGVHLRAAAGQELMLSYVTIEPHAVVEEHSHPHEQAGMVVSGSARFIVGNQERVLRAGDLYFIPGGVKHRVVGLEEGCVALDVFHPVREEYL
ncbi:MAG: cupin domain-containing protein [Planctomycetaceae bacterium]